MHAYVKLFVVCACFCDCVVVQWFRFQTVGTLLLRGIFDEYTNMPIGRPALHRAKCSAVSLQTQPRRYGEPFLLMPPTTSSAANFARVMELGPDNNKTQFIFFLSSSMSIQCCIHQTVAWNRNVEPLARAVNNQTYARRVHDQVSM